MTRQYVPLDDVVCVRQLSPLLTLPSWVPKEDTQAAQPQKESWLSVDSTLVI